MSRDIWFHGVTTTALFAATQHPEALSKLSLACFERNAFRAAFMLADRRCRIGNATAADLYARARALHKLHELDEAQAELLRAARLDPTHAEINQAILSWGPGAASRNEAERLIGSDAVSIPQLHQAVEFLLQTGPLASKTRFVDGRRAKGWAVCRRGSNLFAEFVTDAAVRRLDLRPDESHAFSDLGAACSFDETFSEDLNEVRFQLPGEPAVQHITSARKIRFRVIRREPSATKPNVLCIVAVTRDRNSITSCLNSVVHQSVSVPFQMVVVDKGDNSELDEFLRQQSVLKNIQVVRSSPGFGIASSLEAVLTAHAGSDVLLLDGNTVLPEGAIDRLRRATYSGSNIGAATPISNSRGFAGFATPPQASPSPTSRDLENLDGIFKTANREKTIVLPSVTGCCLFIKRACLDSVGWLPAFYEGNAEYLEFSLAARTVGFVSVCATDVYVAQSESNLVDLSGRSPDERELGMLKIRHSRYEEECRAFVAADPFRNTKARVELRLPVSGRARLIVDPTDFPQLIDARVNAIGKSDPDRTVLVLSICRLRETWRLQSVAGPTHPQSLSFDLSQTEDCEALTQYLRACSLDRIEWLGITGFENQPAMLLAGLRAPIDIICSTAWPLRFPSRAEEVCTVDTNERACEACRKSFNTAGEVGDEIRRTHNHLRWVLKEESGILYSDSMARAYAERAFPRRIKHFALGAEDQISPGDRAAGPLKSLGVLMPEKSVACFRLLQTLSQSLFERDLEIVVFGETYNDLELMSAGNIFVTGKVEWAEYERLIDFYRIDGLFLPYRSSNFWVFGLVGRRSLLRRAYFDWSFGLIGGRRGDLQLDPQSCDRQASARLARWIAGDVHQRGAAE